MDEVNQNQAATPATDAQQQADQAQKDLENASAEQKKEEGAPAETPAA